MLIVLVVLGTWVAAAWWLDRSGRRPTPSGSYAAVIVPGCAVLPSGQASSALARRVRGAVDLYDHGWAPLIVVTGGTGSSGHCEGSVAAALCVELGVPSHAVRVEGRSTTTDENARFAAEMITGRVLVVTDAYHVRRCRSVFRRHFPDAEAVACSGAPRRWRPALREVGAWWKALARVPA